MLWIKCEYCVPFFSLHLLQKKTPHVTDEAKGVGVAEETLTYCNQSFQ